MSAPRTDARDRRRQRRALAFLASHIDLTPHAAPRPEPAPGAPSGSPCKGSIAQCQSVALWALEAWFCLVDCDFMSRASPPASVQQRRSAPTSRRTSPPGVDRRHTRFEPVIGSWTNRICRTNGTPISGAPELLANPRAIHAGVGLLRDVR
jgi:hypothetical protein